MTPWEAYTRYWRAIGGPIAAIPGTDIPDAPCIRVIDRDEERVVFVNSYGQQREKPL